MSIPGENLSEEFRSAVLDFYGRVLGWQEIESLRLPDRMTVAVGRGCYVNLRARHDAMTCHGYEHFGVLLASAEEVDALWQELDGMDEVVELEALSKAEDGFRSFRFRHLLPLAVEVQFQPSE